MGPNRNPRWEQKRTEGYAIVSNVIQDKKKICYISSSEYLQKRSRLIFLDASSEYILEMYRSEQ